MTRNWINNDREFINSGLGKNGQKILINQCNEFETSSLKERVLFIKKLLNEIIEHKKTSL